MIGVVSYGGYIPRLRLDRMAIYRTLGWFTPATLAVAQGERSVCNWDEDSLSMAVEASRDCLAGMDRKKVDALYLCSTTLPYADRQNAGIAATALNLPAEMATADITSCQRAGTTGLITALEAIGGGSRKAALVAASDRRETRGGYFYEMWFGDGAASVLLGSQDVIAEYLGSHSITYDLADHYRGAQKRFDYMWEERWVREEGYAKFIPQAIEGLLQKTGLSISDFAHVAYPCFFTREHRNIGKRLGLNKDQLLGNLHLECGETGAAHPLVLLVTALERANPGDRILVAGFGQGCDALAFRVTGAIRSLPPRRGIAGSLARKAPLDSYAKFARFRDLLDLEYGIRGELGGQTPMTALYRDRKMILGLMGARCTACQTPQFPPQPYCVNPECGAFDQMEEYHFSERLGRVVMYTGDRLAVTTDPPAIYGLVQFEGGGRMLLDFTDCALEEVSVGLGVRMSFRKRWYDKERGYTGYFWKAVPQANA
ncbi:MAG: hydroxymethylglutaryl-CoA synthase family protein [Bradymonadales bacterium]|nr:hydroxymethylglutaryl-CoA synthase family protein [Bradymonadales bacterium]